jgi:hypothetical protein
MHDPMKAKRIPGRRAIHLPMVGAAILRASPETN